MAYLCNNFINRSLYKLVAEDENIQLISSEKNDKVYEFFKAKNLAKQYYFVEDCYTGVAYKDDYLFGEKSSEEAGHIWLINRFDKLIELGEASAIIKALKNNAKRKYRVYCDRSIVHEFLEEKII